ncbi:MAG: hypothetical protein MUO26_10845 [Methanotrichaceae archaeon]|nr:hypothetical protein [Methanotrichaceae archaeon]
MLKYLIISKSRKVLAAIFFLSFLLSSSVLAHAPTDVNLSYDQARNLLNVTISHSVSDPTRHYVMRVEVTKNGEPLLSEDYTSQPLPSKFTYSYNMNALAGDKLIAKAFCSIAGSTMGKLILPGQTRLVV